MPPSLRIRYPRLQFLQPHGLFWSELLRTPRGAGRTVVGQLGLAERFFAGECFRRGGTPNFFMAVQFHSAARIWTGQQEQLAPAGATVWWAPGQPHRYGLTGTASLTHTYAFIAGRHVEALNSALRLPTDVLLRNVDRERFDRCVFALADECTRAPADAASIDAAVSALLLCLQAGLRTQAPDGADARALQVKRMLELDFCRAHRLAELARTVGVSPPHLSALFKKQYDVAPIEYVIKLRLQHARHLLTDTTLSIKQVAAESGYNDPYLFSRLFKKHHGVSPQAFRTAARKHGGPYSSNRLR